MIDGSNVVLVTLALLSMRSIGMAGAPGENPPSDIPDIVPDVVTDLLDGISEFVGTILKGVATVVGSLVHHVAEPKVGIRAEVSRTRIAPSQPRVT